MYIEPEIAPPPPSTSLVHTPMTKLFVTSNFTLFFVSLDDFGPTFGLRLFAPKSLKSPSKYIFVYRSYERGTPRTFRVIFCGPKGCGKTSLLNALVERTSSIPRHDEAVLEFHEIPSDKEGMDMMIERLRSPHDQWIVHDWVVYVADATDSTSHMSLAPLFRTLSRTHAPKQHFNQISHSKIVFSPPTAVFKHQNSSVNIFLNKSDLPEEARALQLRHLMDLFTVAPGMTYFSANKSSAIMTLTKDGMSKLITDIEETLKKDQTKSETLRGKTPLSRLDRGIIADMREELQRQQAILDEMDVSLETLAPMK
jgi:hypothetical protein